MQEYSKIVIYSVGLLGGSLGAAFRQSGFAGKIVGISSPRSIAAALRLQAIDEGCDYSQASSVLVDADLLILCSPIEAILRTLGDIAGFDLPAGLVVTDVGSTKRVITEQAQKMLPPQVSFIGGHPMAGSEKSGAANADPLLFENAVYVLTEEQESPQGQRLASFLTARTGCRIQRLHPAVHDRIAAAISHVPHIAAVAMVEAASQINETTPGTLSLAAGGFRSATRIASSSYSMWGDIFRTNRAEVLSVLGRYEDILQAMRKELEGDDLEKRFNRAARVRQSLAKNRKGFLSDLFDIAVVAADRPGFLAHLTATISTQGINIKDIELLKVREGDAGTFMLSFGSLGDCTAALDALRDCGIQAWRLT
ncbi:MAG: prephenate dehydrogenase/arogenate dehydrogenase family protein [Fibrobacterota bacterium]